VALNILIFLRNFPASAHEVAGRRPDLKISVWTPSVTVHSHFNHWLPGFVKFVEKFRMDYPDRVRSNERRMFQLRGSRWRWG